MVLLWVEALAMICMTDALLQWRSKWFAFELRSPQSQSHGDCIQFTPVDAHLLVVEGLLGKGTLAPLSLKVTTEALVAGIGKQLHI